MASSPPTAVLGGLGDISRPSAPKTPARTDTSSEKSSFSDVFQQTRDDKPDAPARPASGRSENATAKPDTETPPVERVPAGKKTAAAAATPAPKGNELPPGGEVLPLTDLLDQMQAELADDSDVEAPESKGCQPSENDGDTVVAVDPALVVPLAPVMPDTPASAAAAALAARGSAPAALAGDDAAPTAGITDATQKREVPTAAQALDAVPVPLSGDPDAAVPVAVTATPSAAVSANATTTADPATTEQPATDGEQPDIGVTLRTADAKPGAEHRASGEQSGGMANRDGNAALDPSMARVDTAKGATGESDTDRSSFRDTLKQIDSTLAASNRTDTAPVTATRESGLRQYIDSGATTAKVDVPVGKPGWSDAVAGKVMWMSAQNLSSAEIQLNPPDLGPLSVRVSSHQDQTSVYFSSTHAPVRDALDQSLPKLREMMGNQGIQLLDVGVGGQGSMRDQRAFAGDNWGGGRGGGSRDTELEPEIGSVTRTSAAVRSSVGLLDAYA